MTSRNGYYTAHDAAPSDTYIAAAEGSRAGPSDAIAKATASIDNLAEVERRIARLEAADAARPKEYPHAKF